MRNTLLVTVLITTSIISRAYSDDTDDKMRRLEARITQLEQRLAALEEKQPLTRP
jgi:polyhydroxyalkanoate synthesis regulator phasin